MTRDGCEGSLAPFWGEVKLFLWRRGIFLQKRGKKGRGRGWRGTEKGLHGGAEAGIMAGYERVCRPVVEIPRSGIFD